MTTREVAISSSALIRTGAGAAVSIPASLYGSRSVNVAPWPGVLSTAISPSMIRQYCLHKPHPFPARNGDATRGYLVGRTSTSDRF